MKINLLALLIFWVLCSSCSSVRPEYLRTPTEVDQGTNGSFIKVYGKSDRVLKGELIAIDDYHVYILDQKTNVCTKLNLEYARRFKIYYAKTSNYAWTVPVFTLSSLWGGFFAVLTLPLNLAVTSFITAGGKRAYRYTDNNLILDDLRMFARFPQGIPPGIDLIDIKPLPKYER